MISSYTIFYFSFVIYPATELPNCVMCNYTDFLCNYTDFCETTSKNKLRKIKNTTIVYILQINK